MTYPLALLACGWLIGIYAGSVSHPPSEALLLAAALPAGALLLWPSRLPVRAAALVGLALLGGMLCYGSVAAPTGPGGLAYYNGRPALVDGVISADPDVRDTYINLEVDVERLATADGWRDVHGKALVRAPRYPEYAYGQRLRMEGLLETPPEFDDFSYRDYLARQGIHTTIRSPQIQPLNSAGGDPILAAIYGVRARCADALSAALPDPQASLLVGTLLGLRKGMSAELNDAFIATGTVHIIAISGWNITILVAALGSAFARLLGRRRALLPVLLSVALYTIAVGAGASVVRAALMGGIIAVGLYVGRPAHMLTLLTTAAAAITAFNPLTLWDVSFQLSFLSLAGLVWLSPPLLRWMRPLQWRMRGPWRRLMADWLLEPLVATLAAQAATLPIILANFQRLSLVAPVANIFAVPAFPAVMLTGALCLAGALVHPLLGQVLGWVAWLPLSYLIGVVRLGASLPFASLETAKFDPLWFWAFYVLFVLLLAVPALRARLAESSLPIRAPALPLLGVTGAAALLVWIMVWQSPDGRAHVVFVETPGGGASYVQTVSGRRLLLDGGAGAEAVLSELGSRLPLYNRSLDLVVATGAANAKMGGLVEVTNRHAVRKALDLAGTQESPAHAAWLAALDTRGVTPIRPTDGAAVALGADERLEVLGDEEDAGVRFVSGPVGVLWADDPAALDASGALDGGQPRDLIVALASLPDPAALTELGARAPVRAWVLTGAGRAARPLPSNVGAAPVLSVTELGTLELVVEPGGRYTLSAE